VEAIPGGASSPEGGTATGPVGAWIACPYCGESVEVILDPGGGPLQQYVEDCEVCCRPWHLTVRWDGAGEVLVEARTEEEA
jgi:hypothetical protein